MVTARKQRPSYADIEALPAHLRGEIIAGELVVHSRPAPPHALTASRLGFVLGPPFGMGSGGPGGWWILHEPELSLLQSALRRRVGEQDEHALPSILNRRD